MTVHVKLQNCSFIRTNLQQYLDISTIDEFDTAKITAVKTIKQ